MKKQRKFIKPKCTMQEFVMIMIASVAAISLFMSWIFSVDFKKATTEDWNMLYEQAEMIQNQKLETVVNSDDLNVKIEIESEECALILKMGEDHKFSEIIEKDNAIPTGVAIFAIVIMGVMSVAGGMILFFVEGIIIYGIQWFCEKLERKRET